MTKEVPCSYGSGLISNARGLRVSFMLANMKAKITPFLTALLADGASIVAQLAQLPLLNLPTLRHKGRK